MFQPDTFVVYPAQGVGKIERIDCQEVGGAICRFYFVRIVANNITLMVPVRNAANVGLRHLISKEHAENILAMLLNVGTEVIHTGQNWNRRYREYSDKLRSGDLSDVTLVVRELLLIGRGKELSFGERRLLEQAMTMLAGELAQVLSLPEHALRERILAAYAPPEAPDEPRPGDKRPSD